MILNLWSRDSRNTIKSCASVVIIGTTMAAAMLIIRLVGEQRLQRFLNRIINLKIKTKADKLTGESLVSDN